MSRRKLWLALLVGGALLLMALILSDALPWLRGPAPETPEWYWPYLLRPAAHWWPSLLAALAMWGIGAWWLREESPSRRQTTLALVGLVATSLAVQVSIAYADNADLPQELINRVQSNLASGFFEPSAEIDDLSSTLRAYPETMPTFASEHAQTHPPGLIVANHLTIKLWERWPDSAEVIAALIWPNRCKDLWLLNRSAAVAAALASWILLPLLAAALTILPAFGLARRWLTGRTVALAALLAATVPSLLLFAPKVVQLYAPLALMLVWLFDYALQRRSWLGMLLAGMLLSLLSFLSLGNAALALLLLVFALLVLFRSAEAPPAWSRIFGMGGAFALGAASFWLGYWLAFGVAPWAIAQVGLGQHYELVTNLRRYDWWLLWNVVDVVVFGGWPTVLGFGAALGLAIRRAWHNQISAVDALAISLLVLMVGLDVSGSARGEVGRIWVFFLPLLAFPAARFWSTALPGWKMASLLVGLQLAIVVSLGVAWQPVRAVAVIAQEPVLEQMESDVAVAISAEREPITLSGYTLTQRDDSFNLTLVWQADGAALRPYTVFTQLLDANGTVVAQQDNWPVNGEWPPTCWRVGDTIPDGYTLTPDAPLTAGTYQLVVGLYDAQTGERVVWDLGRDHIELQTVDLP